MKPKEKELRVYHFLNIKSFRNENNYFIKCERTIFQKVS